ncbi:MAG TPA: hypothetical protein VN600_08920 [Gemmatimonadaceae bacterium]|nr:hypothetical protein [Gemmatimonadaceae bacterium]
MARTSKPAKRIAAPPQKAAEAQLAEFLAKFSPEHQALVRSVRRRLRRRFSTATEMVYDNYNFFVIGYSPTDRPSDAIISIAAGASGVGLCFIQGAKLPDPKKILIGSGKQTRFVRLETAAVLDRPEVGALLDAAEAGAKCAFPTNGRPRLVIRSVSAKQRPRRKPAQRSD